MRPDGDRVWFRLKKWTIFCTKQAHPATISHWSTWPAAGVCVATGFNNLVAIDIDDDELVAPILAVLPEAFVGKVGRKGLTALLRSAEPMPSTPYDDANGHRLLDFLSDGRQSVIPGTFHPVTGRPYEWTTERTLLTTPLEALPLFTSAHREEMEKVLRRFGWKPPAPSVSRREAIERPVRVASDAAWEDDGFDAIATARRREWLPLLGLHRLQPVSGGWRAVASFRPSGSGKTHNRGQSLSIRDDGPIVDHGTGQGYNNATLVAECRSISTAEAYDWLRAEVNLVEPLRRLRRCWRPILKRC